MYQSVGAASSVRNAAVDWFKGVLVLLVIMGHFFELLGATLPTWIGFGFRMPLFIGLSGYMFNLERARAGSLPTLLGGWGNRLLLPWVAAAAFYVVISGPALSPRLPFEILLRPPFHLWYVPVLLSFMIVVSVVPMGRVRMLLMVAPFSLGAMMLFGVGHDIEQFGALVPDRRYFIHPLYFCAGLVIAQHRPPRAMLLPIALIGAAGMLWWWWLFDHGSLPQEVLAKLMLNLSLIALLPTMFAQPIASPLIESVGVDSMFFYLWHPLLFGLLFAAGMTGLPVLGMTLLLLLCIRAGIRRAPVLKRVMGLRSGTSAAIRPVARSGLPATQ